LEEFTFKFKKAKTNLKLTMTDFSCSQCDHAPFKRSQDLVLHITKKHKEKVETPKTSSAIKLQSPNKLTSPKKRRTKLQDDLLHKLSALDEDNSPLYQLIETLTKQSVPFPKPFNTKQK
jgi:hypothetical protein